MPTTVVRSILLIIIVWPCVAGLAAAQNPFTFVLTEHQAPATMLGTHTWTDVDADGDMDMLQFGNTDNLSLPQLNAYRSNIVDIRQRQTNSGSIIQVVDYETSEIQNSLWLGDNAWLDIDGDGDNDLVLNGSTDQERPFQSTLSVLLRDGSGLTPSSIAIPSTHSGSISAADVDGDGDRDMVLTGLDDNQQPSSKLYINNGGMSFVEAVGALPAFAHGSAEFGDFDTDGDIDLLFSGVAADGSIRTEVYENDGAGTFTLYGDVLDGAAFGAARWGDYDGDGDLDILVNGGALSPNIMDGLLIVYQNNNGSFVERARLSGAAFGDAAWGDFDNDGDLDILVAGGRETAGQRSHGRLYLNSVTGFDHVANLSVPFPTSLSVGDYDGDGDLDVSTAGLSDRLRAIVLQYENRQLLVNNRPEAPTTTNTAIDAGNVTFSWNAAVDVETPAAGLTYALRVGTTPGGSEVISTLAADDSGRRQLTSMGNVYHNTSWTLQLPNGTYFWAVQTVDNGFQGSPFSQEGSFIVTESSKGTPTGTDDDLPVAGVHLFEAYPNPFSRTTSIEYTLPVSTHLRIDVYNVLGQKVSTLASEMFPAGRNVISWDATSDSGQRLGSGVYFIRLEADGVSVTRSVIVR